jgi:Stage II sporulation protein E (SpoIIE)/GAF domain
MVSPPPLTQHPGADSFRDRTLARVLEHVRSLVPAGSVRFVAAGEEPGELGPLVEAAAQRERPLLVPRLDAIACPLRTESGRLLGVLVLSSVDDGRPLRRDDLRTVGPVADMAALAIEQALLVEAGDRLKQAGEDLSSSLELAQVYRRIVEHAAGVTGAAQARLTRLDARAGRPRTVAGVGGRLTLDAAGFAQIARTRRPMLLMGGSVMHAPIELGPRLYGVLTAARETPGRFGHDDLDLLAGLARSAAAAIANAIHFEREHRIARALTLGFVPEALPGVPGFETGVLYAPALGDPSGGDLYGTWPLPGGEVAVLVGDVAGKGVENAALSAMARFFIEARSWDSTSPVHVLEQANAMLLQRLPNDTFVTAFLGVLSENTLRWTGAGHPPALLFCETGVHALESRGLPLGIDAEPDLCESELELARGDLLFTYTDGLMEARRGSETYGLDRLFRLVSRLAARLAPEDLVRTVHDEVTGWAGGLTDDAAALALRRR